MNRLSGWLLLPLAAVFLAGCSVPASQTPPGQPSAAPSSSPVSQPSSTPMPVPTLEPSPAPSSTPPAPAAGSIEQLAFKSAVLGRDYHAYIYLPAGYETGQKRYPVVYLLHGRGETMAAWARVARDLDRLIAENQIPALLAVMPDMPSSERAGYYIDSQYSGKDYPAEAVESAFFKDLIPYIDQTYRTVPERTGRVAAGYSMGGYGAMRYLLAHPEMFIGAVVLSPAVYNPLPPADSSTREFGAFGSGSLKFDPQIYQSRNYEALFAGFTKARLQSYLFIAVGDDEAMNPDPADAIHDLDFEAHVLYNKARRVDYLSSQLRVYDGPHGWEVWRPGLIEGLTYLSAYLR